MVDEEPVELELPDGVHDAEEAVEVLRAWIADGSLHVVFDPETFRGHVPEWGRLLGDIAHHVAHALTLDGQAGDTAAIETIREAFNECLAREAPRMSGGIRGRTEH